MNKEKIINFLKWFFHSYIWVGILLLIVDIISKNIIANNMNEGDSITLIPGFLSITYTINRHAAFGIGPDNPMVSKILYIVIAAVATVGISIYFAKNQKKIPGYMKAALMIIVAGAIGNMIDRIFYSPEYLHAIAGQPGGVVDFIDFFNGSKLHNLWHYIFNIADCGVVIGAFMLAAYLIIDEVKESRKEKAKKGPVDNTKVLSESEKKKLEEQEKNRAE
ncbi:MAG: signal peptidase II [Bacilli bacterium]|nr:signal peptidase II [Bacilli bacterium]